jgi:phosphatidate cytidylyltransferase
MASTELRQRLISGIIFGAVVITLTLWSFESFAAMCAVGFVILLKEWWSLTKQRSRWWLLVGVVYTGAAISSLIFLRYIDLRPIVYLLVVVWTGDIAAYFVGKRFGRHKILPSVSPGKSWEGLAGSIIASISVSIYLAPTSSILASSLIGSALSILGLMGDLFESSLKRRAGVKDSGTLIPGHGGLFDRVDALLPCAILLSILVFWALSVGMH